MGTDDNNRRRTTPTEADLNAFAFEDVATIGRSVNQLVAMIHSSKYDLRGLGVVASVGFQPSKASPGPIPDPLLTLRT